MIRNVVRRRSGLALVAVLVWTSLAAAQSPRPGDDLSGLVGMLREQGRDDSLKGPLMRLLGVTAAPDLFPVKLIAVTVSKQPRRLKLLAIPRPGQPDGGALVVLGALDGPSGTIYRGTAGGALEAALSVPPGGEPTRLSNAEALDGFRREVRWWLDRQQTLRDALRQPNREPGELCMVAGDRLAACE